MFRTVLVGALTGCLLATRASAQEVEGLQTPPLTLSAAVREVFERHPALISLRAQTAAADRAAVRERFLMPPTLEAQIWAWPVTTLNPARTDMYMFMAEQELPGNGKRAARELVALREADV